MVSKKVAGVDYYYYYEDTTWKTDGSDRFWTGKGLTAGYGILNSINITRDGSNNFVISFNGDTTDIPNQQKFTDATWTGGDFGFYAIVGTYQEESFPQYPVDIRFQQISAN